MQTQMTLTWQGDEVDVDIEYSPGSYHPACTSGNPDNWHPDESEPPEITSIKVSDTCEEILSGLSESEVSRLTDKLMEQQNDYEPDYEPNDIGDDDWQDGQDAWEASQGI